MVRSSTQTEVCAVTGQNASSRAQHGWKTGRRRSPVQGQWQQDTCPTPPGTEDSVCWWRASIYLHCKQLEHLVWKLFLRQHNRPLAAFLKAVVPTRSPGRRPSRQWSHYRTAKDSWAALETILEMYSYLCMCSTHQLNYCIHIGTGIWDLNVCICNCCDHICIKQRCAVQEKWACDPYRVDRGTTRVLPHFYSSDSQFSVTFGLNNSYLLQK